jgi:putative SOS response-associated peptidase YedK
VEKGAKKPKYEFTIPGQEPFGIAAVWKIWKNPGTNQWEKTFAVLTGEPNEVMKPIHNRMTTFLKPRDYEEYLTSTERPLLHLLRSRLVSSTVVERLENPGSPRIWPGKSLRRVPVRMID